ncbi:hypothetical protein MKW92_018498 [Papaver armeniacum]|nr:hypothetical protein MKW92_018498 [Papaver armeniacum]
MHLTVVIDEHLNLYPNLKLKELTLASTNLKGSLNFTCHLTNLVSLDLSHTNLTGTIPSCLFKLKQLGSLDLSNNILSSILPLPPQNIVGEFDVSNNKLSGEISMETGERLSKYQIVLLSGNAFSGSIPSSIFPTKTKRDMDAFVILDLSNNKLTGSIPTNIWNGSTLSVLNLGNNNLTGIVPKEIEFAETLENLLLYSNHLDGTINFIGRLCKLRQLNLANNNFGGNIPTTLGSLKELTILSLRSNKLGGPIPEEIIQLQNLCILDLSLNNLSGRIPKKLGNLSGLIISNSCYNQLTSYGGFVDYQLSLFTKGIAVQVKNVYDYSRSLVDLSCNALEGNIPKEIGLIKALSSLNLSHNQFYNDIPENIGNLSALESLDLSSNRLSGSIPQSLTTIDTLAVLNFSCNMLSGRIPRGTHFDTLGMDGAAFTGNDLLCGFPTEKKCKGDHNTNDSVANPSNKTDEDDPEDIKEKSFLYAIVVMGFIVGFWGLFFVLLLKKEKLWFPYWRFVNSTAVRITNYIRNYLM